MGDKGSILTKKMEHIKTEPLLKWNFPSPKLSQALWWTFSPLRRFPPWWSSKNPLWSEKTSRGETSVQWARLPLPLHPEEQLHFAWLESILSRRKRTVEKETRELLAGGKMEGRPGLPQKHRIRPVVKRGEETGLLLPTFPQSNTFPQSPAGPGELWTQWIGPLLSVKSSRFPWKDMKETNQVERTEWQGLVIIVVPYFGFWATLPTWTYHGKPRTPRVGFLPALPDLCQAPKADSYPGV